MRMLALALAAITLSAAQRQDRLAGVFANDRVMIELFGAQSRFTGTLTVDGQRSPVTVVKMGGAFVGTAQGQGQTYSFLISPIAGGIKVVTQGTEMVLMRRQAQAPPAPPPAPTALPPAPAAPPPVPAVPPPAPAAAPPPPAQAQAPPPAAPAPAAAPGGVRQELVGKWCWISVLSTGSTSAGRTSNQCFTLNPNGTYQYYGESDNYGRAGSVTQQHQYAGRWTATDTTLTTVSSAGTKVYRLEKRNHPKNRDPMIVLDGQTFVTYYRHAPW